MPFILKADKPQREVLKGGKNKRTFGRREQGDEMRHLGNEVFQADGAHWADSGGRFLPAIRLLSSSTIAANTTRCSLPKLLREGKEASGDGSGQGFVYT